MKLLGEPTNRRLPKEGTNPEQEESNRSGLGYAQTKKKTGRKHGSVTVCQQDANMAHKQSMYLRDKFVYHSFELSRRR